MKAFEDKYGVKATEEAHVKLWGQLPPIEKMDASLGALSNCTHPFLKIIRLFIYLFPHSFIKNFTFSGVHLSLSTNAIDKIGNLSGLHSLKILSLGRNQLKKIEGVADVANTLEELWISYNNIERLTGVSVLKKLRVLYMSNNKVDKWSEFERLQELTNLEELLFTGNPLEEAHSKQGNWRIEVIKRLPKLKKLDGEPIKEEERIEAGVSQ